MKIIILGTRGIPNFYGGFEQFAEYLALFLVKNGHEVIVYNGHTHPYQEKEWNGVQIIHCFDPEFKIGTAGQFIYDLNCIFNTRRQRADIVLQLGYTSSSIWGFLMPRKSKIVTNMDGLEWKRSKYSRMVQRFLLFAEYLGVRFSDSLVADSLGIKAYLKTKYNADSTYIPYGATRVIEYDEGVLQQYGIKPLQYSMLIARLEPENSIEMILEGVKKSCLELPFLVVGNHNTPYGAYLKSKFGTSGEIRFLGGIYDMTKLNSLRYFSHVYFHGHTVGGTNPSLLEAMASGANICAHDNVFNRSILGDDALYFVTEKDVRNAICSYRSDRLHSIEQNFIKIEKTYSWDRIVSQYERLFLEVLDA